MLDINQKIRYTKDEVDLMKQIVKTRPDAPLIIRNHFLQLELQANEKDYLTSLSADILTLLKKIFLPELSPDLPFFLEASPYSGLSIIDQLHPELGILHIFATDIALDYFKQQFDLLTKTDAPTIILNDLSKKTVINQNESRVDQDESRIVNMMAYNKIIPLIEGRSHVLIALTSQKEETPEEQAKRESANSTK